MVKPFHIFLLMIPLSIGVYYFNDLKDILDEVFLIGLVSCFLTGGGFSIIDKISAGAMLALSGVNIVSMVSPIVHQHYLSAFIIVYGLFMGIILSVKLYERISE